MADSAQDFPVSFEDPADAGLTWRYDREHMANALSPLEFELGTKGFLEGFGWGMVPRQFNYFVYFAFQDAPAAGAQPAPTPDSIREAARRWRDEILPEVLEHTEHYRATDFDAMTNEQLSAEIDHLAEVRVRSGELHTLAIRPHWEGMNLLIAAYKELTGGSDLEAMRLVQAYPNKSFESGERLWQVGRVAAGIPRVRDRLLALEPDATRSALDELRRDPDAAPFVEAFDAYLDAYGWRTAAGFGIATWREDPSVPLMLLRAYLQTDGYDPDAEQRRLAEERDAALRETLSALDDVGRARLEDALEAACQVAPQLEDHNFFIDQRLMSMPRRFVLAAGRRLGLGDDVFFLVAAELRAALAGETEGLAALAAQRKQEFARWRSETPPPFVGVAPPGGPQQQERSAPREQSSELRGTGVSAGVVRGPARIVAGMNEAGRLCPGDVLVTTVTQPSWTPLFAVARAVVTEVGGMLSHTAVASREFGIPAVVAVANATRLLKDGQLIEVDGTAGTVRVL